MKFSAREDIDARCDAIFARLTDFEAHENMAMRRGIQVRRTDDLSEIGPGLNWSVTLKFRGKPRQVSLELCDITPDELLNYAISGSGITGTFLVELVPLSPRRTRMSVGLDIRPRNLSGRLIMQSLRILKPTLNRRFRARAADYARALSGGGIQST